MTTRDDLGKLCDEFTARLLQGTQDDPEQWSQWIIYTLKVLEDRTGSEAQELEALERAFNKVRGALAARLDYGRW